MVAAGKGVRLIARGQAGHLAVSYTRALKSTMTMRRQNELISFAQHLIVGFR